MPDSYVLEWKFTPVDYFDEEPVELECEHGVVQITSGRATCVVPVSRHQNLTPRELWTALHEELEAAFLAAETLVHKPYTLEKPSFERHNENGSKQYILMVETAQIVLQGQSVNLGNERQVRRVRRAELAQFAVRFAGDPTAAGLLRSYQAAVNDPNNELVHLYEIRDALKHRFGGGDEARAAIGISSGLWDRLGVLSNGLPLRQGRHRGLKLTALRDATPDELKESREISLQMIEAYLRYLGRAPCSRG